MTKQNGGPLRAHVEEITQGLALASGGAASDFSIAFYCDRDGYGADNQNVSVMHLPTGAALFGWMDKGRYAFSPSLPRFKRCRPGGLERVPGSTLAAPISAAFSVDAMAKGWEAFGRGLWRRAMADTVAHWPAVPALIQKEADEDRAALAVCELLRGRGWDVRPRSGGGGGWYATHPNADAIWIDEYGRAAPDYKYRTYDPERLAAFLEAEGKN